MPKFWWRSWQLSWIWIRMPFPFNLPNFMQFRYCYPDGPYWHPLFILCCDFLHPCCSRKACAVCSTLVPPPPHFKRTHPRVPIIWFIKMMIIIQVSNIEGRRNAHVWRKSNHISIVVDFLSNLKWPILLALQFVVGTNRKSLLSKIDRH